ncbi:MAG: endonuclease/exonuclease/phosphatase family protein [Spirochaetaceae bacterium]|jgi:endonuclease/exonuclease/phosphatase family metal-dependent hydrolase|nr:endonuclease/exonuclease/phosphatase family protein [Spirochaetaceae bacterium]
MTTNKKRQMGGQAAAAGVLYRVRILWFLVPGFLLLGGCSIVGPETSDKGRITIASWNVQALFDGIDNGVEYDEYSSAAGWNSEKYQARLHGISGAIKGINEGGGFNPDVLALIEVENPGILRDLAELPGMEYKWNFFAGVPGSAIGIGIFSRFPFTETRVHSAHFDHHSIPRPVAEVWINYGGESLVIMACHWKSKSGGARETELLRQAEAGIIARRLEEISAVYPETPVIILGDLNENHDDFVRTGAVYPCALMPDSEEAAAAIDALSVHPRPGFQSFLVLSPQKPPRPEYITGFSGAAVLYSPWEHSPGQDNDALPGSYYYDGAWETIDHFLLNAALFDKRGWEYGDFRVLGNNPFTNAGGIPHAYNPRTGTGLSDHLPILLDLVLEE